MGRVGGQDIYGGEPHLGMDGGGDPKMRKDAGGGKKPQTPPSKNISLVPKIIKVPDPQLL